jgi:hypothetical protein
MTCEKLCNRIGQRTPTKPYDFAGASKALDACSGLAFYCSPLIFHPLPFAALREIFVLRFLRLFAVVMFSLLSNLRGIIGEHSDLRAALIKEHSAATIFGGEDDPLDNRPSIIAAFPLGIQYLPVIHSQHIVGWGITDNRAPIPFLLEIGLKRGEANQQ